MIDQITFIEQKGKKQYAILPIGDYPKLLEALEYLDDCATMKNLRREKADESFPAEMVFKILDGKLHPLAAYREYRGLSQAMLAKKLGVTAMFLSHVETGRRNLGRAMQRKAAKILKIDYEMLEPAAQ